MRIAGSAAIVTGGGSGLGAATAAMLAEAGARVTVIDRDAGAAQALAEAIGARAAAIDVTDADGLSAALVAAEAAHGPVRIAVNCAGIGPARRIVGRDGPHPLDAFRQTLEVNLLGTFNVMRLVAHRLMAADADRDGQRGIIVNTASVAAFDGQIGQAAYAASKGGIVAMTLPAARELARAGIRVVTIAPGIFETPLLASLPAEARESLAASIPCPARLGRPAEFAATVRFAVETDYLNGTVIRLDGAIRMPPR